MYTPVFSTCACSANLHCRWQQSPGLVHRSTNVWCSSPASSPGICGPDTCQRRPTSERPTCSHRHSKDKVQPYSTLW